MAKKRGNEEQSEPVEQAPSEQLSQTTPPIKTERDVAMDFAVKAHRKFSSLIKASVLFGSQAKNTQTIDSDIDIILIVDDATIRWDIELVAWYREELAKIISASNYNRELHINTIKLTTWWQDLLYGDPVVINIIRYGEALIDIGGFFNPLKALLLDGKVRSTPEAVYAALQRAPMHLSRSHAAILGAIEGIYWTMADSAQAALITAGKMPPSPEHISQFLKETFVDTDLLKMTYVNFFTDMFNLHKSISHGKAHDVKGNEIDKWQNMAESFLSEMTSIINRLLEYKEKQS
jgi:uncharacterized protein (UPF0332 family)/predicted nucleotidyltransferase